LAWIGAAKDGSSRLKQWQARLSFELLRQAAPISTPETIARGAAASSLAAGWNETMRALGIASAPLASIKG
jgi:hypothetical protein